MISTHNTWAAIGEIQRAIHQILLKPPTDLKESELDDLDQIDQLLYAMLKEEV